MRVGILGGTGPAGKALAVRLASVGVRVTIGSRSLDRAADACTELTSAWPSYRLDLLPGDNDDAASGDLVVVATPWDGAGPTARTLAARLEDKVVVSMANALIKVGREFQPLMPPRGSVAAEVAAQVPRALVAAAFHHLPARELGSIDHPMDGDVLICSDHPQAVTAVADLVRLIPGLRPLDAGSLAAAA
ncbi:MAG: NADPH-dependent F420 reductase, partial [Acidimicrobiales bacterium]